MCRAYEPSDLPKDLDVIIAGAETAWLTPACVRMWREQGVRVIGLHSPTDRPGKQLFETAGADAVLSSAEPTEGLVATARALAMFPGVVATGPTITVVSGPAGSPGRTESAVGLACLMSRSVSTLLIDLDHRSPSVALRLGLPPGPNIDDAFDTVRSHGTVPQEYLQMFGSFQVLAGSLRGTLDQPRVRRDIVWAARQIADHIIVDAGVLEAGDPLLDLASRSVLVCDASPVGIVRAAALTTHWTTEPPAVILNRTGPDQADIVRATRYSLGLEPQVLVPYLAIIRDASVRAQRPPSQFVGQLQPLAN